MKPETKEKILGIGLSYAFLGLLSLFLILITCK